MSTLDLTQKVSDLQAHGNSPAVIAKLLGISRAYAYRIMKENSARKEEKSAIPFPLAKKCVQCEIDLGSKRKAHGVHGQTGFGWKGTNFCSQRCFSKAQEDCGGGDIYAPIECAECGKLIIESGTMLVNSWCGIECFKSGARKVEKDGHLKCVEVYDLLSGTLRAHKEKYPQETMWAIDLPLMAIEAARRNGHYFLFEDKAIAPPNNLSVEN